MAYNYPALRLDLVLNYDSGKVLSLAAFSAFTPKTEGLKFHQVYGKPLSCSRDSSPAGAPIHRCRQHHTAKFHLISHFVTASPRGEADCSLRPGGEGGATRRMRASLTVRTHEIRRIGGMTSCRPAPRIETPRRAMCLHTAAKNKPPIRTA